MATEQLPVVDLRALSMSDLDVLAASSAHALAPRSCPDEDPLPPLKIDRAVFNESAGSRKQTFSRLRLAAASSSPTARSAPPSSATRSSARNDPESNLLAYHLRRLFVPDDPSLLPPPEPQTLALTGRSLSPPPDPDRETTNSKGISVDLVRLAGVVDPYDAELRRRTAGMGSESELMGFISSLAGRWASQRRRRKFVDASFLGDHLPRGWKLLLGLKRKERMTWVHCFSYVSPKGTQFATCKEVSSYLMSLLGYPEAKTVITQYNGTEKPDFCADNGRDDVIGFHHRIRSSVDNPNVLPITSVTVTSYSGDLKDNDERNVDTVNAYECQNCNLTFQDQISYSEHYFSSHDLTAKRRRTGIFGEPILGKDGKIECPVCLETFAEESRYFGHVDAHARYQGLTPGAFLDKITSEKVDSNSLAEISFSLQELEHGGEAGCQHLTGSNERGNNSSKAKDLFSANCLDGFNRPNEAWHRPEEIPHIPYAPNVCDVAVTKVNSNPSGQPDGSRNVSEVTVYNDQASSHHVFRPNTYRCGNPYDQIVDHGMSSKHGEVNNTVKARDVNLNSCSGTSYLPIASASNEISTALNEASQSPFAAKCFNGSFSNNVGVSSTSSCSASTNKRGMLLDVANKTPVAASTCFSASYGNNIGGDKANFIGNKKNTMVYQSNMGMQHVSSMETEAGCFASRSVNPENSDKRRASNTKEQMDSVKNRACNNTGFGTEAYNNNNSIRGFAQFSSNFTQRKSNDSSHCSLPESNTLKANNWTKGTDVSVMNGPLGNRSDVNCMRDSYVNRHIHNNDSNVSMHEMQNRNDPAPGHALPAAVSAGQNVNGPMSAQANVGSRSPMVRSVGDAPMSNTTQDQCDLQLGFGVQKQHIFSGYGEFRSTTSGSPQSGMPRNNALPAGPAQFETMARPNSFPSGSSQFGSLAKPDVVPTSFQFGIMARPNSVPPAESSQFGSVSRPYNSQYAKSTDFGSTARPPDTVQFGSMARPDCVSPPDSSQFGSMVSPNSEPHVKFSQFGSVARSNYVPPANSSQFGSTARSSSFPPTEASQFGNMTRQNFVSRTEPTLVLGYAPQMGNAPPVQVGWDLSSPKVTRGMVACVCIWCNSQFHHFGPADAQQTGSFGFICPACKERYPVILIYATMAHGSLELQQLFVEHVFGGFRVLL
ncbi:hypothetical protein PR202_gb02843 [Eleusine coracana subsp. coracana]|uniref:C2H2-type domain-containing protein n=1 Tax=Eleusine coracana subsp. coracana TaxID=191504 RepID=A0AAV5DY30_ELECO|nr:hypothetical protein PR202_gb02843 [Eleusine coracana subsp. coracana]